MNKFKLSKRSISNLEGVNRKLQDCVHLAIQYTSVDFGVIEGVRTLERQRQLVAAGASQTMKSNHLSGNAVDLAAYIGTRLSWEPTLYDDIADAMKLAAEEVNVPIRWGGAWHIPDIRKWDGTMQDATDEYIQIRRNQGRRPFFDGPHFEINWL